jgi:TrmH family RNA methyltransferase
MEVDVVLVRPTRPGNVAAACRAMKNMGLSRLVLISPPPGLGDEGTRALAYGAWEILDRATRAPDLGTAVRDATFVVGTTGKPAAGAWDPRRLAQEVPARAGSGRVAIVFGPEASGLKQDELDRCHQLVHIPTHPAQPSLNLAQAVLIVAYELWLASGSVPGPEAKSEPPAATAGEIEAVLADLRGALLAIGYLNPQNPEAILTEIRRLLARRALDSREAALLRGLARQIRWAGTRELE